MPCLFVALSGYFAWHAMHGDRGLIAREQRLADIATARAELARAETDRDAQCSSLHDVMDSPEK